MICPLWLDDGPSRAPAVFANEPGVLVFAESQARSSPLSRAMLEGWHKKWFETVVPLWYYAGHSRGVEAGKECLAQPLVVKTQTGQVLPTSNFGSVRSQFDKLMTQSEAAMVKALAAPDDKRAAQIAAVIGTALGKFIQIHPFMNGNGRLSRLLWRALLARANMPASWAVATRPAGPYEEAMHAAMNGKFGKVVALVLNSMAKHAPPAQAPSS